VKLFIIADDFTGALDTGVKFAAAGISTKVVTDFSLDFLEDQKQEDVVVVVEMRKRISENLGGIADFWIRQDCTLMIIGGDTVQGFAVKAHLRQIIPIEEIATGSVLSQIITDKKRLYLISKSGGFGEETLLEEIAEKITKGVGIGREEESNEHKG